MKGRKPIVQPVSNALTRTPKAPAWLSQYAAAEWKRVGKDLVARRILTDDNLSLLESYTVAVGMVRDASDTIAREGATLATEKGMIRHPAVQTLKEFIGEARRLASELGLTPTSRNKIGTAPEENDDELADMGV
jgi:P27 family predicted phage terminase small subunit